MRIPTSVYKPTTTTTSVCQRAAQGRVWSRRDGARWKPGGTVGPRWDGGHRSRWKPGPRLPLPANTVRHHRTVLPACPGLSYILILCAFYPQSVVHNHFWLVWNSRIPFPCKHYDQNHCVLDNHLLSPVPLQPMSSSAMYYVPISWSVSGTCYCICVCILLQPITQGLCLYIFCLVFYLIHNTFNLCQYVATTYISKRSSLYVCVNTKPLYLCLHIAPAFNTSAVYLCKCTMDLCPDLYPDQTS